MPPTPRRRLLFILLTALLVGLLLETASLVVVRSVIPRSPLSFTIYDPGFRFDAAEVERYFAVRDPLLGWPALDRIGTAEYAVDGSRPVPGDDPAERACVTVDGDSFTYGTDVGDDETWARQLGEHLGCRVGNFGVPGYGTDQAFLRFRERGGAAPDVAILGVATVDILRLVNRDRRLIWEPQSGLKLKPRFRVAADGSLELLPLPGVGPDEMTAYVARPATFLADEWFLPDSPAGPVTLRFPHALTLARSLTHPRVRARLAGRPSWSEYYDPAHPAGALPLLVRIGEAFAATARERDARPLVLIIPTGSHLPYAAETGDDPVAELTERLTAAGVESLDLTPALLAAVGARDVCDVFDRRAAGMCLGHYNAEGSRMIAAIVADYLARGTAPRSAGS